MIARIMHRLQVLVARRPFAASRECCLCGKRAARFLPYRGGWDAAAPVLRLLNVIGSDLDNYQCPWCGCNDRERHLWLYLSRAQALPDLAGMDILHFAPEAHIARFIRSKSARSYQQADLFPVHEGTLRVDLQAMPFQDGSFDLVIANHVLEHVADENRALNEIRRVLRPGAWAILQTPYSPVLEGTLSDAGVVTPEARLHLFGQEDHVRFFGRDFVERICRAGFRSRVLQHDQALPDLDVVRFGVNPREPLLLFERA